MTGRLSLAWRIALRELRGGTRGFRVFLLCLTIGAAAIAAIGTLRAAIEAGLSQQGAVILGGDAEIRLTYRHATAGERAWLDAQGRVSELVDFRSMLVTPQGERALTQVKAVDAAYPLYGKVTMTPDLPLARALAGADGLPGAVIDPALAARLDLAPGDVARLGRQDFVITATLDRMPDGAGDGFSLGPPMLVRSDALASSGLIGPGTLYETRYRIAGAFDPEAARAEADVALEGTGFRWRDRRAAAPGIESFVKRLSAFLVLVGLAGLAVGGVGVSTAVRAYLEEKTETIATLRTLGAGRSVVFLAYGLQIGLLAGAGILVGLLLGAGVPVLLGPLIVPHLPVPIDLALRLGPLAEAALYTTLGAALFTLWPLARMEDIRAADLFRQARIGTAGWPRARWMLACAGLLAGLVGSVAWLTGFVALTLWTAGAIVAAFVALVLAALAVQALARRATRRLGRLPRLRFALGAIGGADGQTRPTVVSLGLGLSVLATIGQIDHSLRSAISSDLPEVAPSFFVIDIQPDQLAPLTQTLTERGDVSRVDTAPMLRGVITRINGRPAQEVAGAHWVLEGDRGITYSATPPPGTTLTAGHWWAADHDGPPEISFAAEEAAEMGLRPGDRLTVNVLGRDLEATITSLREVDFSTGGIGFVMSMNPAALQGAPHTHIATVYADPTADADLLRGVSATYPNITMIRVREAIDRVSEILGGIATAVTYGALATLLTGVVVLIGTAAAAERARLYEGAVLRTLGATRGTVLAGFAQRAALTGLTAGLIALAAGMTGGWAVSVFVMDTAFAPDPLNALGVVGGGVGATLLAGLLFAWGPLNTRPARVLRARE